MPARPRLSLCIPTYNRASCFQGALESGLREAASLPPGTVEVVVCDNASTDQTPEIIDRLHATHPELRAFRNPVNVGFDRNYLRCVDEAQGEFAWILGDDDVWLPGSATRVLQDLDAGADACLVLSQVCDQDLNPFTILPWFLDPNPPTVWTLNGPADLSRYFNSCARNAAVFAFISVTIFRRDRMLEYRESILRALGTGYVHLWGMMEFLRRPLHLHYIPEALIQNRLSDTYADSHASRSIFSRWMHDLYVWTHVAEALFGDDPEVQSAFFHIVGRNHHNTIVPGLRKAAPTEAAWLEAVPYLVRAGFPPAQIAAVDLAFQHLTGHRLPMPTLNPATLCLADLGLVARGAKHVAILALGKRQDLLDGIGLLEALENLGDPGRIRIFCTPEGEEILKNIPSQFGCCTTEAAGPASLLQNLIDFSPELLLNLDSERGQASDDLVAAVLPTAALAFEGSPESNHYYSHLMPKEGGLTAMREALGL